MNLNYIWMINFERCTVTTLNSIDGQMPKATARGNSVIDIGADAIVERIGDGTTVRKSYRGLPVDRRRILARREFDALKRTTYALSSIEGIRVPRPVRVEEHTGAVEMEFIDGERLDQAISSNSGNSPDTLEQMANSLADALLSLSDELSIEELDFSLRNTLVENDQSLVLIDFTAREQLSSRPPGASGIEIALASFLTSSLTYRIRRSSLFQIREGRRLRSLSITLMNRIRGARPVDIRRIRAITWQYYWRQAGNRGWKRHLWFHSFGMILFWWLLRDLERNAE